MTGPTPLLLLTGFLGAGKTTLLSHWLADPEFSGAAVIVNELGRVGIDPHLVGAAAVVRAEEEGCICCTIRGTLGTALEDLVLQRTHRRLPEFTRVIVECTGLAEPGPILEEILHNKLVSDSYRLEGVVTAVDAVEGERQLVDRHEALAQVLVADTLVITKTDLAGGEELERLEGRLAVVNRWAPVIRSSQGHADPRRVLESIGLATGRAERRRQVYSRPPDAPAGMHPTRSLADMHGQAIGVVTLRPDKPMDPTTLRSRLEAFLERHGERVLRIKGMVPISGQPGPALIHAVAGVLYPVRLLARWPEGARPAMVIITEGVPDESALHALDEVPVKA